MPHRPTAAALVAALCLIGTAHAAPTAQGTFSDALNSYDTARWFKADGWINGAPFANAWLGSHTTISGGVMSLQLDNAANTLGKPYSSGQYQSNGFYGYGCYETRMKPVANSGVVSSFFTYAGPSDNGGNGLHNEIDIEFLGNNTKQFQTNFWTNSTVSPTGVEHLVPLAFDASTTYHRYGFKWTSTGIEWFVDGASVYKVLDSTAKPTPKVADSLQKIMVNVWPVDATAAGWAGTFTYPGTPLVGGYDFIKYLAGETCSFTTASQTHVESIAMALATKNTQVTAKVTVLNGDGTPVPSATVSGVWSGPITGTGTGLTDSTGAITFTSAKSNTAGTETFCVSSITATGSTYVSTANVASCNSIAK